MLENYLKITWKVLGRNKFFTFVSLFGITFTIGILLVLTTFYDNMLGDGYPEVNRDRTLLANQVWLHTDDYSSNTINPLSLYFIHNYISKLQTPELIAFANVGEETTTFVGDKKIGLYLKHTSATFWQNNQFEYLEGKSFNQTHVENQEAVAVITSSTRDEYFGEGESAVGKPLETGNKIYKVIGVVEDIPANFLFAYADIFVPYTTSNVDLTTVDYSGSYIVALQARDKSDFPAIKAEFASMIERIELPSDWEYTVLSSRPLTIFETIASTVSRTRDTEEPPILAFSSLLFGAMFLFMLIPALNLVNLNSSRIRERASEIGVRKAFGASTRTLAIQFIIENVILTLLGGILGLIFSFAILEWIESLELIPHANLHFDYKVFFIAVFLCVFFGVLSGVLPALRMSKIRIVHALKGHNL